MSQTNESRATDPAFAGISENGLNASDTSGFHHSTQLQSTPATKNQNGKFHPNYLPEFISTPAAIELREFYLKARKTHPIRKRNRPYSGASAPLPEFLEVIE